MRIKRLDLLRVRGYEYAKLEFSPGINLIVGENNSGKSTILKALQCLQNSFSGLGPDDIRKTHDTAKMRIQLGDVTPDEFAVLYKNTNTIKSPPHPTVSVLFHFMTGADKKEKKTDRLIVDESNWSVSVLQHDITQTCNVVPNAPATEFRPLSSMEDENSFIYLFLAKRKPHGYSGSSGKQSALNVDEDMRNLPSRIKNLDNRSSEFYEEYKTLCDKILGFPIGSAFGQTNNSEDKIAILVKKDPIYLESMGEGIGNILGLLSILCTDDNKLFLIEELENDIHPAALKKLLEVIIEKSSNNQFIISTHSNIVLKYLASAPGAKIFNTKWEYKPVSPGARNKIPTTTVGEVENTVEKRLELLEELGYDLLDFDLYKSYIIFEESSAEQIVKELLIPVFVPKLRDKVKTISTRGAGNVEANVDDFLRIFVYLNESSVYKNKAWVIVDGDKAGQDAISKLRNKFKQWPDHMFKSLTKSNLEELYPEQFTEAIEAIKVTKDRKDRFLQKKKLTGNVMKWMKENREEAIAHFEKNAKEVINILKEIDASLS